MARRFHQVVEVVDDGLLTDRKTGRDTPQDGKGLVPGIYLVLWRGQPGSAEFDRDAHYIGPLPSPEAAQLLKTSAAYLGLIETNHKAERQARNTRGNWGKTAPFDRTLGTRPGAPVIHRRAKRSAFAERPNGPTDAGARPGPGVIPIAGDMEGD